MKIKNKGDKVTRNIVVSLQLDIMMNNYIQKIKIQDIPNKI